jgi:squalene-hopene/tetraprenyl-beta-curcumene cyclase
MTSKSFRSSFLKIVLLFSLFGTAAAPPPTKADDHADVTRVVGEMRDRLLKLQRGDGSWAGDVVMACRHTAYYIITCNYVGHFDKPNYDRALNWLISNQSPEGTWGSTVQSDKPVSLSNTGAGLLALEVAGVSSNGARLTKAREYIVRNGGFDALDPLLQTLYALYGRMDWDSAALTQFDLSALTVPDNSPISVSRRPPWWREGFVPVAALRYIHRKKALSSDDRQNLRKAEEWLLSHQLSDGAWFTAFPTFFAIMALYDLDKVRYAPLIEGGFRFLESLRSPNGYQRPFELSVWDTATAISALRETGLTSCNLALQSSLNWLLGAQSPGGIDLSEAPPGGWSYNPSDSIYSDNDDTSLTLLALSKLRGRSAHLEYKRRVLIQRGLDWVWYMQGDDGGWATFLRDDDKDNDSKLPTGIDDWSVPDVTGHVLLALGALGFRASDDRIQRAIGYLMRSQTERGSWYGRWGLSYLYGTSAVLVGLKAVGADLNLPFAVNGRNWLINQQNADGGWGERFSAWNQSYGISYTERSPTSTPEQTAWVIMGLLAAGMAARDPVIRRGVDFLLKPVPVKSVFPPGDYTVLGIDPYSNSLYATDWPLMALGEYQEAIQAGQAEGEDPCAVYALAYQGLPSTEFGYDALGAAANLSYSLTAEDSDHARLWVENKGKYEFKQLSLALSPDGAPADKAQRWSADSLKGGSRLSWRVSIPSTPGRVWNLELSYIGVGSRPFQVTRQLTLERWSGSGPRFGWIVWVLCLLVLLAVGWNLWRRSKKYRPLLSLALNNLKRHPLRTGLTSLGIILGTAAIGATLTLSLAFRAKLIQDFATFGTNRLIVLPYNLEFKFGPPASTLRRQPNSRFDKGDVAIVKALRQVSGASPFAQEDLVVARSGQSLQMTVMFVDPETYGDVAASRVESGRFLNKDAMNEIVLGYAAAHDAYDSAVQVGDKLTISASEFEVVGIMSEVGGIRGRAGTIVSPDIAVYVPLDEAPRLTGRNTYDGIEVRAESAFSTEGVATQIEEMIKRKHTGSEFSVITSERLLGQVKGLLWQFTAIVVMISVLTLIVSGVGVANMMLISIKERLEEIGIIKALGARDRTVLMIFLSEAACIGVFSALAGSAIGFSLLLVLQWIVGVGTLSVAPYLLLFSVFFSLLITLGSGSYPAYVAARLDPAEAIRRA